MRGQRPGNASRRAIVGTPMITNEPTSQSLRRDYEYYREVFHDRPMPFAFVDLDLLD